MTTSKAEQINDLVSVIQISKNIGLEGLADSATKELKKIVKSIDNSSDVINEFDQPKSDSRELLTE